MDTASMAGQMRTIGSACLLEIRRIHGEDGTTDRAVAAGTVGEDWAQQRSFQIILCVHPGWVALALPEMQVGLGTRNRTEWLPMIRNRCERHGARHSRRRLVLPHPRSGNVERKN